jgi:hypothetical protein
METPPRSVHLAALIMFHLERSSDILRSVVPISNEHGKQTDRNGPRAVRPNITPGGSYEESHVAAR